MKGMPFNLQGKGVLELVELEKDGFWYGGAGAGDGGGGGAVKKRKQREFEPRSVLDHRSPSPPTSTSTLSSSLGGGGGGGSSDNAGVAAVSDTPAAPARKWPSSSPTADRREEWPADLQTIPAGALDASQRGAAGVSGGGPLAVEDWETMLSEPAASPGQEQTFLRWIMGDIDDPSSGLKPPAPAQLSQGPGDFDASAASFGFGFGDAGGFGFEPLHGIGVAAPAINPSLFSGPSTASFSSAPSQNQLPAPMPSIKVPSFGPNPAFPPPAAPLPLPPGMLFQESMEEKPQLFAPSLLQSHATQNPAFFFPEPHHQLLLPPHPKRHHPMDPDLFLRRNNPYPLPPPRPLKSKLAAGDEQQQQQQQALVDQLFKAAELIEAGNSGGARGILARLNHQLPPSPPLGKPLLRSASYFRDALQLLLSASPPPSSSSSLSTPLDVVLKLSAYKAFSDVSPVLQFTNFTSIQALLEELAGSDRIHVIDFDIGVGGQWSSFMQELAQRRCAAGTTSPVLKITAFISPTAAHHPLELHLTRENLSHFAADLNIAFEFNAVSLDSFDPVSILAMSQGDAFAVNLPVGSAFGAPIPAILRLVKQLSPKIVISVDHGCDRSDLPFSHHFLHALQSGMVLLDSIDAAGANHEIANKIERFLLQPRIENSVLGRHRAAEKLLPWRTLFASTGFVPLQFSNFTETQAECLLKRVQVRGFHVEKRQASLFLYWQRGELVSVSAWRC